jgi:hypothetical protein
MPVAGDVHESLGHCQAPEDQGSSNADLCKFKKPDPIRYPAS